MQASVSVRGRRRLAHIAALVLCAALPHAVHAQAPSLGVFTEVQTAIAPSVSTALEPATVRSRVVQVDTQKITAARRGRKALRLNLFDDAVVEVRIRRVRPTRSGYFISGTPKGVEWGEVRLVVNGPVMVGTVVTRESEFTIRSVGSGRHVIRQIDPSKKPFECGVEDAPIPARPQNAISSIGPLAAGALPSGVPQANEIPTEDGSEVRVLVVYTPALQARQGGAAGMRALIDLMIQSANQAFEDGGINPRLVLAHSALVDYVAQESSTDLGRLKDKYDGHMDEVHSLRNEHAADLVHLLTESTPGPAGTASRLLDESLAQAEEKAFAVTATAHEETFTHETGHNFGLRHDRYVDSPEHAIYPYAFGYINKKGLESDALVESRWRTVMAYRDRCRDAGIGCRRLLRFSNPDQTHMGDPLGVPEDDPTTGPDGPADARLTINNSAPWVGSFRSQACSDIAVSPETSLAPVGGGEIVLKVEADPGCLWEAEAQGEFLTVDTETPIAGSGFVNLHIDANQSGAERSATLTLAGKTITVRQLATSDGVCNRTTAVMEVLSRAAGFSGAAQCDQVTEAHLASIGTLQMYNLGLSSLKQGDFDGLEALTFLNLQDNQLTDLPAGLFKGLSNLQRLTVNRNQLTALPSGLFAELPGLKYLRLDNNQMTNLPADLFAGLANLEELHLGFNKFARLPAGLFSDQSSLKNLTVSHGELTHLSDGLFSDLSSLEGLDLFGNQIGAFPAGVFAGLSNLQELNLGSNPFSSLPDDIFAGLDRLEILSLWNGSVIELPASVFASLSRLRTLDLTLNPLTELPDGIFVDSPMLERLILWGSSLTELSAGVFADLSRLRELDLNANDLSDLPADIFAGLSSLERLVLSRNRLTGLPPGIFAGLDSLSELRLDRNAVDPLPVPLSLRKVGDTQFKATAPTGAPFALVLEVNANEGGALEADAGTVTVPVGALESEPIGVLRKEGTDGSVSVDIGALPGLPADHTGYFLQKDEDLPRWILASDNPADATLIDLSLNGGELEPGFSAETSNYTISVPYAVSKTTVTPTTSNLGASVTFLGASEQTLEDADPDVEGQQVDLALGDNTIVIAVTAVDGVTEQRYRLTLTREENNCERTPQVVDGIVEAVKGVDECGYLTAAHLSGIIELDLSGRGIPSLKSGDFAGLTGLERLVLIDNQLSDFPDGVFSGLRELQSLALYSNQLAILPVDVFSELSSLRYLYLNDNQLSALPSGVFSGLARLEDLWLDRNQLTSLPGDLFSGLSRLESLHLNDNQLQSLPADIFSGLSSLLSLWIHRNELSGLPEELFSSQPALLSLLLSGNQFTNLPAGVFSDLADLQNLHLSGNRLTSLPEDLFSGLSKLDRLYLSNNRLTSVPDGLFSGLSSLRSLDLSQEAGDLQLALSLEKVGDGRFRAKVPSGAPYSVGIPIIVSDGGRLEGEAGSVTVALGELESAPATIIRLAETTQAVTVDIGTIPGLPRSHSGYEFSKDESLPLEILPAVRPDDASLKNLSISEGALDPSFSSDSTAYSTLVSNAVSSVTVAATLNSAGATVEFLDAADRPLPDADAGLDGQQAELSVGENTIKAKVTSQDGTETRTYVIVITRDGAAGVCFRTEPVREAIVSALAELSSCALATDAHLARITALDLRNEAISHLKAGDFAGLTALATLRLNDNRLSTLPQGIFIGLTTLQTLDLSGNLADPLPLLASLEKVGDRRFKAVTPAGAPFALVLPIRVNSAGLIGEGATNVTIPAGAVESIALEVTRVTGTEESVTVDIGALPPLPQNHAGYALEKGAGLPLEFSLPQVASPPAQVAGVEVTVGIEQLDLSWDAVADADGYKVQWKSGDQDYDDSRQVALLGGETTSYTIIDLTTGTEYTIRVIATKDHADDGEPSGEVTGTPANLDPDPDVNADGTLDGDDAQAMYQAYASEEKVGDGESGGTPESRRTLLSGLAGTADPTDEDLKAMLRKANVWRSVGLAHGGDINEDGAIDGDDAFVMYYAYEFADLVGDGKTGGTARHRQHLLASRSGKDEPTDEDLKKMLRRANKLKEDFG